ncbi:uncharacterized protein K452DRAFT_170341 [Aplosporella prunicola CBS 121167]|uniref:Uncharacterized protein n=1 Tax=Aplosporella prunicola CBS 121167 TaxID=1176127 RepID=A0A6A6BHD0_9PEZI|nr:uncharacterized protein K452DRAFT_170341 [Aplosporella prunicola CBS 121167]KAF2143396.1 hypothetical protein K452DRAFT_170341 [Aplosporella prunicola CBS 121167]
MPDAPNSIRTTVKVMLSKRACGTVDDSPMYTMAIDSGTLSVRFRTEQHHVNICETTIRPISFLIFPGPAYFEAHLSAAIQHRHPPAVLGPAKRIIVLRIRSPLRLSVRRILVKIFRISLIFACIHPSLHRVQRLNLTHMHPRCIPRSRPTEITLRSASWQWPPTLELSKEGR